MKNKEKKKKKARGGGWPTEEILQKYPGKFRKNYRKMSQTKFFYN